MTRRKVQREPARLSDDGLAMLVPLTQGKFAAVDLADWPTVSQYNWCAVKRPNGRWYAYRARAGSERTEGQPLLIAMHTQITGWAEVDHVSRDGLDNRRDNLRPAARWQNNGNHVIRADSKNAYKGVHKRRGHTWSATCRGRYLGSFRTEEAAARAYDTEARSVFGEFARLNFPEES